MKKNNLDILMITVAGCMQILISLYFLFIIVLGEIRFAIFLNHSVQMKHSYLVSFVFLIYSVHLLLSGINLLKFRTRATRLQTIGNMFSLAVISLIYIFWISSSVFSTVFCFIFLSCFIYFIYYLTRRNIKECFQK